MSSNTRSPVLSSRQTPRSGGKAVAPRKIQYVPLRESPLGSKDVGHPVFTSRGLVVAEVLHAGPHNGQTYCGRESQRTDEVIDRPYDGGARQVPLAPLR